MRRSRGATWCPSIVDEPVVAIGGGGFGINLHLAPADLVAALDAQVADVSVPEAPHRHDEGDHHP